MRQAISTGHDPIIAHYDIARDTFSFRLGDSFYEWHSSAMPFTLKEINGMRFADRALIEEYGGAKVL